MRSWSTPWLILGATLWMGLVPCVPFAHAEEPPAESDAVELAEPWLESYPIPFDPELEQQIQEVQDALGVIHEQIVRRKEALNRAQTADEHTTLDDELNALHEERELLTSLLDDLVEEAKASERTAIDEALARARWLERQREQWEKREELTRERKE